MGTLRKKSAEQEIKGTAQKVKGVGQEIVGRATGNERCVRAERPTRSPATFAAAPAKPAGRSAAQWKKSAENA